MRQKSIFILILFVKVSLFVGCKNEPPVKFIKVYNGITLDTKSDSLRNTRSVFGTYYAFNYKDADLKQLIKMLDTLSFDTSYHSQGYRFMKYNSDMPDTTELNKARITGDYSNLEDPGSSKFYKYQILDFIFMRHHFSEGRYVPDNYSIDFNTYGKNKANSKYYIRDSVTKKLREIEISVLYPRMKDTF